MRAPRRRGAYGDLDARGIDDNTQGGGWRRAKQKAAAVVEGDGGASGEVRRQGGMHGEARRLAMSWVETKAPEEH